MMQVMLPAIRLNHRILPAVRIYLINNLITE